MEILSNYKRCPYCGEDNIRGAKYCTICHNPMDAGQPVHQGNNQPQYPRQQQQSGYGRNPDFKYPQQPQGGRPPMPPRNYMTEAILVTIFCCQPLGIVSIVLAAGINSDYRLGNYEKAERQSRQAGTWVLVSFIVGLVANLLYIVFLVMGETF